MPVTERKGPLFADGKTRIIFGMKRPPKLTGGLAQPKPKPVKDDA